VRRLAALAALCVLVLSAVVASTSSASPARQSVYVDGDSLAVGTTLFLSSYLHGWKVHTSAGISRHVDDGVAAIKARGSALEHVVVVDLGTNDDPSMVASFTRGVRAALRAAGPDRCVIWSTINRPPYRGISWEGYNKVLRREAATHDNLHVFEWAAMARAHRAWFGKDGVHPNATGYKARAAALAKLIKDC
jgi:lysophospholipase L1-like esterase